MRQLAQHELRLKPEHPIPEPRETRIPPGVCGMSETQFQSELLQEVADLCARRQKSLRYRGKLNFERGGGEGERSEWLRIVFRPRGGPVTIVEVLANRVGNIYVRSARRSERGKVLVRIELLSLTANAKKIGEAIVGTLVDASYEPHSAELIRSHWRLASLAIAGERTDRLGRPRLGNDKVKVEE